MITNVAMDVGLILGVVSVAMDIHAVKNERELAQELVEARGERMSQFIAIAKDLETQIE
ncbi:hypothetical protein [Oscillatoria nigro-viridis]|uniref:hypothetical protein n=1 Tax=Phormidium nigroviride TaxID=482564 RepID=UPI00167F64BB|nr:hypothetical protein [Oscillatoria nigro-viridis]